MEEERAHTATFSKASSIKISYEMLRVPEETQEKPIPVLLEEV